MKCGFEMKDGFTLLEVLISLAIVGILIVVILEGENLTLRVKENSSIYTELILSGNDLLSRILSGEEISLLKEEKNEWEVEVEDLEYCEKVKMKVRRPSGPLLILHTYRNKEADFNI